jgi:transcriptional regulator with XRE-family HTH domain
MLSQRDLARLSGVSRASIVRLEQRPNGAYYGTIIKLAEALGVEPADLRDQLEGVA